MSVKAKHYAYQLYFGEKGQIYLTEKRRNQTSKWHTFKNKTKIKYLPKTINSQTSL